MGDIELKCFSFIIFYICLSVCRFVNGNICWKSAHCFLLSTLKWLKSVHFWPLVYFYLFSWTLAFIFVFQSFEELEVEEWIVFCWMINWCILKITQITPLVIQWSCICSGLAFCLIAIWFDFHVNGNIYFGHQWERFLWFLPVQVNFILLTLTFFKISMLKTGSRGDRGVWMIKIWAVTFLTFNLRSVRLAHLILIFRMGSEII